MMTFLSPRVANQKRRILTTSYDGRQRVRRTRSSPLPCLPDGEEPAICPCNSVHSWHPVRPVTVTARAGPLSIRRLPLQAIGDELHHTFRQKHSPFAHRQRTTIKRWLASLQARPSTLGSEWFMGSGATRSISPARDRLTELALAFESGGCLRSDMACAHQ